MLSAKTRCSLFVLILIVNIDQRVHSADRVETVADVIQQLASREQALSTLSLSVTRRMQEGKDWASYQQAKAAERTAMQTLLHGNQPNPASKNTTPLANTQTVSLSEFDTSYDLFFDFVNNRRRINELIKSQNVLRILYFDGLLWQSQDPANTAKFKPSIIIDTQLQEPNVMQALGLSGSLLWLHVTSMLPDRQIAIPLSEYLQELDNAGLIQSIEHSPNEKLVSDEVLAESIVIQYIEPTTHVPGAATSGDSLTTNSLSDQPLYDLATQAPQSLCHQIRLTFDPAQGMIPRQATGTVVFKQPDGQWKEVVPPQRWSISWLDIKAVADGFWLPHRTQSVVGAGVQLPAGGTFSKTVVEETSEAVDVNDPAQLKQLAAQIDWTKMTLAEFAELRITEFQFSNLTVDANDFPDPLFLETFPAGTIVQDNRDRQTYQLLTAGPAIDPPHKKLLIDSKGIWVKNQNQVENALTSEKPLSSLVIWFFVINSALIAIVLLVMWNSRRRRKLDID